MTVFLFALAAHALDPDFADGSYGPHERNVYDLYQADTTEPAPLVIYVHGGGFEHGDKSRANRNGQRDIRECLSHGVSFAAINYRFLDHAPLQEIVLDTARAIQHFRHHAEQYRIDPERIAIYGGSAGAGSCLWVGVNDDLADPDHPDPVLRESTRVSAIGLFVPQATYDFAQWPQLIDIPESIWMYSALYVGPRFYRVDITELNKPAGIEIRRQMDMLALIDPSDPPVYIHCDKPDGDIEDWDHMLHHPRHARVLQDRLQQAGVPNVLVLRDTPRRDRVELFDFLFQHLGVE